MSAGDRPDVVEPALAPEEKETVIKWDKRDDRATIFSEQRGVVSRLLRHPECDVDAVTLADGSRVEHVDEIDGTDTVTALEGTVPVGALKVLASSRESSRPSSVVSAKGGER